MEVLDMDMVQKLEETLTRLNSMTESERKDLEDAYVKYRDEEAQGLYDVPFDLDIPDKLKH